jgi:hypothetical protein
MEPQFLGCPDSNLVAIPTDLSRLPSCFISFLKELIDNTDYTYVKFITDNHTDSHPRLVGNCWITKNFIYNVQVYLTISPYKIHIISRSTNGSLGLAIKSKDK